MRFTLLIPTWNEVIGMRAIMPTIDRTLFEQVLILDGGSTDGTVEWAREQGYEIHIQTQPGLRQAYREVWPLLRGDAVITFSPDGNCLVELFPQLMAKMREGYDMVVVSRYLDHARSVDDDLITGFGNWLFTTTVNLLHGGRYTDCMGIYRAYRTRLPYELGLDRDEAFATPERLFFTTLSWEPLLSVRASRRRLRIAEIPGDEPARIGGERKLQIIRWGAGYMFQILRDFVLRYQ